MTIQSPSGIMQVSFHGGGKSLRSNQSDGIDLKILRSTHLDNPITVFGGVGAADYSSNITL